LLKHLDRKGAVVACFKDNLSGNEWCSNDLIHRNCENIKGCKAEVTPETINSYFDELQATINDVPDTHYQL
jgi:hypothetical protein